MIGSKSFSRLKAQVGWVLYDFANTIFSMNIVTYYFSPWIIEDLHTKDIFFSLSYSSSMLLVAATLPALGRKADHGGTRLRDLKTFTYLCVACTVLLSLFALLNFSPLATVVIALICFAGANYFYEGGLTFYNALLSDVSTPATVGKISGIGTGIGYAGSITGLLLVSPLLGLNLVEGLSGRVYTFLPTALLFLIFALPCFFWVKEGTHVQTAAYAKESFFQSLKNSLRDTKRYPGLLRYMIGNFLVIDAVNTVIIFMGVYSSTVVGFEEGDKLILFLASTSFALVGSIVYGYLTDRIKSKPAMLLSVVGWVIALAWASIESSKTNFYVIGAFFGVFLGAVWTASRPLLNSLVPEEKLGQFYGVYSLCSKAAATVGPLIWGVVALIGERDMPLGRGVLSVLEGKGVVITEQLASTIHYRLALAAQIVALVAGFIVLLKVPNKREYSPEEQHSPIL
ncbi:MAG: MFS transporter [Candidatus Zixiibacteriota bacterium]